MTREGQLGQEAEDAVAERRIGGPSRRSTREVKVAGIVDQQDYCIQYFFTD
jgi:hypothetical protein